jgi:hypothetical protein
MVGTALLYEAYATALVHEENEALRENPDRPDRVVACELAGSRDGIPETS